MNLQKLIQEQNKEFDEKFKYRLDMEINLCGIPEEIFDWHTQSLKSILEELYKEINKPKDHTKEVGAERENPTHEKDEIWGCVECLEDNITNQSIQDTLTTIKQLIELL